MMKTIIVLIFGSLISYPALAFHALACNDATKNVSALVIVDATGLPVVSARLTYRGKQVSYNPQSIGDGQTLKNGIIIIPFTDGQNLVMPRDEAMAFAFDERGGLLGILTCHILE